MITLFSKTLRDLRIPLVVMLLLVIAFQCLWARVTKRISSELMPQIMALADRGVTPKAFEDVVFGGPGKILQTLIGGESLSLFRTSDMLSVGSVHPLMQIIFCLWAVGRAANAIAGEIDRGTMELLLAQPLARYQVVLNHLLVDLLVIPLICGAVWFGDILGIWLVELQEMPAHSGLAGEPISFWLFGPGMVNAAALLFAMSGYTMWLSSRGRFRNKVLGLAVLVTLLQFLINVIGQLWDPMASWRPFTVFYYYQPQQIMLRHQWTIELGQVWNAGTPLLAVNGAMVLGIVGLAGYTAALWTICRRDLPAPL